MTLQTPLTASRDEIVFEGRNQLYGAYVLRRLYNRHLATAAAVATMLCLLLVGVPLLVQRLWPAPLALPVTIADKIVEPVFVVLPKAEKVAPVAPAVAHAPVTTVPADITPTKVVADDKDKPEIQPITPAPADVALGAVPGPEAIPGDGVGAATGISSGKADSGAAVVATPPAPFYTAEVMPEFAGGTEALRRYMQRNLHYPREAINNRVSGQVFVSFVVNADGLISNVEVLKGLGYGTEEEAARVIRNMPAWKPGRQNNHSVAVRYTLPITFRYE